MAFVSEVPRDDSRAAVNPGNQPVAAGYQQSTVPMTSRCEAFSERFSRYVALARPAHYGKNILVAVGVMLAYAQRPLPIIPQIAWTIVGGIIATCLIASSNYVLNEILDGGSDQFHPRKQHRQVASGQVSVRIASVEWIVLLTAGLLMALAIGRVFFLVSALFAFMAILYNVPPLRLKDLPCLDVLTEGMNSPIRVLLGWALIPPGIVPDVWLLLAFWMAGAFAMSWKRLREIRLFTDRAMAAAYRRSFAWYDGKRLKMSMTVYALAAFICLVLTVA